MLELIYLLFLVLQLDCHPYPIYFCIYHGQALDAVRLMNPLHLMPKLKEKLLFNHKGS